MSLSPAAHAQLEPKAQAAAEVEAESRFQADLQVQEEQEAKEQIQSKQGAEQGEQKAQDTEQESADSEGLTQQDRQVLSSMQARDAEVRGHEQAHKGAGGSLTGAISYETERGPDGKEYAIGGHVPIAVSEGRDAKETIAKAGRIQAAALAPADPSGADRAVASQAAQMASEARSALIKEQQSERAEDSEQAQGSESEQSAPANEEASAEAQAPNRGQPTEPGGRAQAPSMSANARRAFRAYSAAA